MRPPGAGSWQIRALPLLLAAAAMLLSGCGSSASPRGAPPIPGELAAQARPIGRGARFQLPVGGAVLGACRPELGPREGVHVEVFAANRVVLIPAGIGTMAPRELLRGRVRGTRCYGALVTLDPTGLVLVRRGRDLSLSALFRSWGQPLSRRRLGPFAAAPPAQVAVFVDGRRWRGRPAAVPLRRHAEIVVEVGPHVPPHSFYAFPPGS